MRVTVTLCNTEVLLLYCIMFAAGRKSRLMIIMAIIVPASPAAALRHYNV